MIGEAVRCKGERWTDETNMQFADDCRRGFTNDQLADKYGMEDGKSVEAKKSRLRKERQFGKIPYTAHGRDPGEFRWF